MRPVFRRLLCSGFLCGKVKPVSRQHEVCDIAGDLFRAPGIKVNVVMERPKLWGDPAGQVDVDGRGTYEGSDFRFLCDTYVKCRNRRDGSFEAFFEMSLEKMAPGLIVVTKALDVV